jgi:cell division protein FtsW
LAKGLDRALLLALVSLLGLGLVQVYSSSFIFATEMYQSGSHFLVKQALAIVLGLGILAVSSYLPWRIWNRIFLGLWAVAVVGLVATFIPGLGVKVGGASRWIDFRVIRFEPSELLKVLVPWLVSFLYIHSEDSGHWSKKPAAWFLWLAPLGLLLLQPDFGTFALIIFVVLLLLFIVGFSWKYFAWLACGIVPLFVMLIIRYPYRLARVVAFLNPWADPSNSGFQLIQSLLSVRNGGLFGQGFGAGQGKLFFLPEAHTDFTLAVFAEETGFLGVSILFLLYGFLFLRSLQIGLRVENIQKKIMAFGITFLFGLNCLLNIAVVLGMLPTKGLTLPFLSYGGSSLLCYCLAFGWILNIERQEKIA